MTISGSNSDAALSTYRKLNNLLSEEKFRECDEYLRTYAFTSAPEIWIAVATVTMGAKDKLPHRTMFMERLRGRLDRSDPVLEVLDTSTPNELLEAEVRDWLDHEPTGIRVPAKMPVGYALLHTDPSGGHYVWLRYDGEYSCISVSKRDVMRWAWEDAKERGEGDAKKRRSCKEV